MTRARVAAYRGLCRSIALLERRIAAGEQGDAPAGTRGPALDALRAERDRLAAERDAVRRFVDGLRAVDEVVWQIVEMYYMSAEKPKLLAVATRMGWQSEFAPRSRLKRFFERVERVDGLDGPVETGEPQEPGGPETPGRAAGMDGRGHQG